MSDTYKKKIKESSEPFFIPKNLRTEEILYTILSKEESNWNIEKIFASFSDKVKSERNIIKYLEKNGSLFHVDISQLSVELAKIAISNNKKNILFFEDKKTVNNIIRIFKKYLYYLSHYFSILVPDEYFNKILNAFRILALIFLLIATHIIMYTMSTGLDKAMEDMKKIEIKKQNNSQSYHSK